MLTFDNGRELFEHVSGVIADEAVTVGAVIEWRDPCALIQGNMDCSKPALWPVLVDSFGRLWKEEHPAIGDGARQENRLVCILDLRALLGPLLGGGK